MADIYLAQAQTAVGVARRVVVKEILPELSGDPHFARLLIEEAKLVAGLRHANVAQVLDLGREGERLFIAMEYVEGLDLNQLLRALSKQKIALPAELALFVVREMLAALDFAHRARGEDGRPLGIVHRDVSPSNVLISFEGEVKLCDFGIAKALGSTPSLPGGTRGTEDGSGERSHIAGKAAYMSPEHARGQEIDGRADVFAAGIVLYELCAGRRLYRGTEAEMLAMAREGAVPPLPERGLPRQDELQAILDRALAVEPADRFATAAELLRALDDYAVRAKLFASQLRFGAFMSEHFEADVIRLRRDRERAAEALARGPAVQIAALDPLPEPVAEPAPIAEPAAQVEAPTQAILAAEEIRSRPAPARPPMAPLLIACGIVGLVLVALVVAIVLTR